MFEISISALRKKQGHTGSIASILLHGALAIAILTLTVPAAIDRHFHAMPVYLPSGARVMARAVTKQPFRRVLRPQPAAKLPLPILLPRSVMHELVIPEVPASPVPATSPVALNLPPLPVAPSQPVAPPAPAIRVGGFESGVKPASRAVDTAPKPQSSGFDSAAAPAAKKTYAAVAGGAFGDGIGTIAAAERRGTVAATQFDAVEAKASRRDGMATAGSGARSPLEITSKPRPLYTEEARRLRIEGEVVLQVMFRASSEICVLRVLRGLGHGLDENAISAASAIRFRPATDGGRPVDNVATVRITFQLAD